MRAAIAAGREVVNRTRQYLQNGESFVIETTLASSSAVENMREAKARGFEVHLLYVCVDDPERNIKRVRERAAQGGHFVPDADIRRRYDRSLANLPAALAAADRATLYDNSGSTPRRVLEAEAGKVTWRAPHPPAWLEGTISSEGLMR